MTDKTIYQLGLTMINGVGDILARHLLEAVGDAEEIFKEKAARLERIPGISRALIAEIKRPEVLRQAEKELDFIRKNQIDTYFLADKKYPERLKECPDAPVLFYFKGQADLSSRHILSIVGTRRATDYGKCQTEQLIARLAASFPDLLIVSGLAYGIDICAHRAALHAGLPTVGVLAHGLDRIYPPVHRDTAVQMLEAGGLLTDFPAGTNPDRPNFIRRNRIVAGLADATVVVESAEKGGSLITADLAFSYGRDVFSFPGRVYDPHSRGCNLLIRQNKAALITSAEDLISALRWDVGRTDAPLARQTRLVFPEEGPEVRIVASLEAKEEVQINQLALELAMPVQVLSALLFTLEMKGLVRSLPGNRYRLAR